MYKAVEKNPFFPKIEENVLSYWKDNDIFRMSLQKREKSEKFIFYDGPPFATGEPHFGHFVPNTVKDIIPRYKTMRGYHVLRRFGWDCHGLPVEYEVEKESGVSGTRSIRKYGVAAFNEKCRSIVTRYVERWREVIDRLGRWVDFDDDYKTMDASYMESIWWVFSRLWEKRLIYKGHYILPYSPQLATPLSNFEVHLGGYHPTHDPSVTVKCAVKGKDNTFFLVWTTTPWTLPSNMGLGVNKDLIYLRMREKKTEELYILAKDRLSQYYGEDDYVIEEEMKGEKLIGLCYEPLFPYFSQLEGGYVVHDADFVSTQEGTGIVHLAGGFGEEDYNLVCEKAGLPVICPIDDECVFTKDVPDYEGLFVKDADSRIIDRLRKEGKIIKSESYLHSYPFCYRTKQPIIYRAVESWFVNVKKIKEHMIDANKETQWYPKHLREGRFGKWLENARDWVISRNRFWGNPIPVWMNDDGSCVEVISSRAQLEKKCGRKVPDVHKHFVDDIEWEAPNGRGRMRRVPEVLDCWFESGAMPYAQHHYPFSGNSKLDDIFPADFISEGLDQTRGWFYTLMILGVALFEKSPFKNVIVNGLVLSEDGKKMSKSERNYTDPMNTINTYGADALRLFLMNSSVLKAEDLKYSDAAVRDEMKNFILPLWNAYGFFVTYANADKIEPRPDLSFDNPLDIWIMSELHALIKDATQQFDNYDILSVLGSLNRFLDLLNNWYIRRSRRRFWKSYNDEDKLQAYSALHHVLLNFTQLSAPIIPFVTEHIYRNIRSRDMPQSVHLCDFPSYEEKNRNILLEKKMKTTRRAIALGRGIRTMNAIKNRQPLRAVHFFSRDDEERQHLMEMKEIILEELNVKKMACKENEEELVSYEAKANYKVLGKQLGKGMKKVADAITALSSEQAHAILQGESITIAGENSPIFLDESNVYIKRKEKTGLKVLNEHSLTAALETTLDESLVQEGIVRDMVRRIQLLRKECGFNVSDRIILRFYNLPHVIFVALQNFVRYFSGEVLAESIEYEHLKNVQGKEEHHITLAGHSFGVALRKR